jgi:5-methyltetrahydrofolate--homocysteine methyltransferase
MIGGAPITVEYAKEIGADGYAPDAGSAVDAAMALLRQSA